MKTILLAFTAATALLAFGAAPSLATSGREAVNKCIDTAGCDWVVLNNGAIVILAANGGIISCKNADAQCTVGLHRQAGLTPPRTDLDPPVGGLTTAFGDHSGPGNNVSTSSARAPTPTSMSLH